MEHIFKDEGCEFDPFSNLVALIIAVICLLVAVYLPVVFMLDGKFDGSMELVFGDIKSAWTFIIGAKPVDARQIMVVSGFVSSIPFYLCSLIYISYYVESLWNPFFVKKGDKHKFYFFEISLLVLCIVFMFFPHYWYLGAFGLNVSLILFLYLRQKKVRKEIKDTKGFSLSNCNVYLGDENSGQLDLGSTTKFTALRYSYRNFLVKSIFYTFPTFLALWFCHFMRGYDSGRLEMLFSGGYAAFSVFLSLFAVIGMYTRWTHAFTPMANRINENDTEYFKHLIR